MGQPCIEAAQKGNRAFSAGGFVGFTDPQAGNEAAPLALNHT